MKKENQMLSIGELINTTVFGEMIKSNAVNVLIKHSTIFSFWNDIAGSKFAKYTYPYAIKNFKMYVSAKSSVVAQELNMYKNKLLKKVNSYSIPLGIEIKDIVFNSKNFVENKNLIKEIEDKPVFINKKDIEIEQTDSALKEKITQHINSINFLQNTQKEKLIDKILLTYKVKNIRKNMKNPTGQN